MSAARLRPATWADHEQIEALKARFDMGSADEAAWRHLYAKNPLYLRRGRDWPLGWVLETDGRIVGNIGNLPVAYELDGRPLVGASAYSWVVDLDHRSQSRELAATFFAQPYVDLFLNTTATYPSGRSFSKFGALKPPVEGYDRAAFWITEEAGFARSLLHHRRRLRVPAPALATALRAARALRHRPRLSPRFATEISRLAAFDERFDAFWAELRAGEGRLLCSRDRASLDWHYAAPLEDGRAMLYARESAGAVRAYAVFLRQDSPEIGLTRMRLVDFQALEDTLDTLGGMLAAGLDHCRREGVHMLEVIGFGIEKKRELERLAPFTRTLPSWMFWYRCREGADALADRLLDPAVWDPCGYDGDNSFA